MNRKPAPGTYEVWTQKIGGKAELLARLYTHRDVLAYLGYHAMREIQSGRFVVKSQGGFSASLPSSAKKAASYRQYWFDVVMDDNVRILPELTDALAAAGAFQGKPKTRKAND